MKGFIYNMGNNKYCKGMKAWGGKWFKRNQLGLVK